MGQAQHPGGHAGHGQSGSSETGGAIEPTAQKPPNEAPTPAAGEYRGSEFQRNRAAAHRISQ